MINDDKTEILPLGTWKNRVLPFPVKNLKKVIRVLGVKLGENQQEHNYQKIIDELQQFIALWKDTKMSYFQKAKMIDTYIHSKVIYPAKIIGIDKEYIMQLRKLIFPFIWDSAVDQLARDTMYLPIERGVSDSPISVLKQKPCFYAVL